jgi:hypothetical protein
MFVPSLDLKLSHVGLRSSAPTYSIVHVFHYLKTHLPCFARFVTFPCIHSKQINDRATYLSADALSYWAWYLNDAR